MWYLVAGSGGLTKDAMVDIAADFVVVGGPYSLFHRGADIGLAKLAEDGEAEDVELGARILPILEEDGRRHRGFRDSVKELTETEWPGWPILGPRTTRWAMWAMRFIAAHDVAPRSCTTKWRHECRLGPSDAFVGDHELEWPTCHIPINLAKL